MSKNRTAAVALASLVLSVLAVVGIAAPASAHDELVSSYPATGSSVVSSPDEITLEFSATLTDLEGSAVIEVINEAGINVAEDAADVSTNFVTQHLSQRASPGTYTVRWKVVSSDGHPISGEYAYSVGSPSSSVTAPAPTADAVASPTPAATENPEAATPSPSATAQTYGGTASGGGQFPPMLYLLAPILILGCGAIGVVMAGRQRRRRDQQQAEGSDV
ncbi:copper resistance CopC family protein [Microbacterium sp. 3J1]|uniref:copper resistance CopC family protein n=1 Tax=Microbacterium sp. 3J1 TaxID=861269 RepID=UPI000AFD5B95|nr:copper resistance CopC family protein [Microbacterium sp. 3J1]